MVEHLSPGPDGQCHLLWATTELASVEPCSSPERNCDEASLPPGSSGWDDIQSFDVKLRGNTAPRRQAARWRGLFRDDVLVVNTAPRRQAARWRGLFRDDVLVVNIAPRRQAARWRITKVDGIGLAAPGWGFVDPSGLGVLEFNAITMCKLCEDGGDDSTERTCLCPELRAKRKACLGRASDVISERTSPRPKRSEYSESIWAILNLPCHEATP